MAKAEVKLTETGYGEETEKLEFYLIDGYQYMLDYDTGYYLKSVCTGLEEPAAALDMILAQLGESGIEISEDEINAVINTLGSVITNYVEIKDGKITATVDLKAPIDDIKAYLAELDPTTKTMESVINDVIAIVAEDLTVADILEVLNGKLDLTVNEALAEIDAFLTEEADTTLQGIYDEIVNNEDVVAALTMLMASEGVPETEIPAQLTAIQSMKIADLITQYEIGNAVLYDLVIPYIYGVREGEEYPTKDELFAEINEMLDVTVAYAFGQRFEMIKLMAENITVDALNSSLVIELDNKYNITKIEITEDIDFIAPAAAPTAAPAPEDGPIIPEGTEPLSTEVEGEYKMDLMGVDSYGKITIVPSATAAAIALPANADVRWDYDDATYDYEYAGNDADYGDFYMYFEEADPDNLVPVDCFRGSLTLYNKEMGTQLLYVNFTFLELPEEDLPSSISVTILSVTMRDADGDNYRYYNGTDFESTTMVINLDHENMTFTITLPELKDTGAEA